MQRLADLDPVERALAGTRQLAVGFADVHVAEVLAGQTDGGGDIILFYVHVEGVEMDLDVVAADLFAEPDGLSFRP